MVILKQKTRNGPGSSSGSHAYDESRFLSQEAADTYSKCLGTKSLVAERGFEFESFGLGENFRARSWGQLCENPGKAVVPIVREFYANGPQKKRSGRSWVRGKSIDYATSDLNHFLRLPNFHGDDYRANMNRPVTEEEILGAIALPDSAWSHSRGKPLHLKEGRLTQQARGVYKFVCARLMPTTHQSSVTWPRAVLIFTILTGGTVDVGNLIYSQLKSIVNGVSSSGYCFPSLITSLCTLARCVWADDLERLRALPAISYTNLVGNTRPPRARQGRIVEEEAEDEPMSVESQLEGLSSWMAEMQVTQDLMRQEIIRSEERHIQFQGWVSAMLCDIATRSGRDPTSIPPWPPVFPEQEPEPEHTDMDE